MKQKIKRKKLVLRKKFELDTVAMNLLVYLTNTSAMTSANWQCVCDENSSD